MFRGSFTALVTPFRQDGSLDEKAFAELVEWQIREGTQGLVPVGTTGESPTLSHDEHRRVVEICVETARGRVPVIAGAGSNNTTEAIALAQYAEKVGADAVLVVTPYYNKPNQRGLYAHFAAVAEATRLPIFIEPNPAGPKYALSRLGRMDNAVRSPMVPVEAETASRIDAAMKHAGLIN
jgi:4-hydroxy-tetrahydrodipicolinate synthase